MSPALSDTVSYRRLFDGGLVIPWRGESREDGTADGFELVTLICDSPTCTCTDLQLEIHPVTWGASGERLDEDQPMVTVTLDLPSGEVIPKDAVEEGSPAAAVVANLRVSLQGSLIEAIRARWHRTKHQDDRDEWRSVDWSNVDLDGLVPFFEAFPSRWDLYVVEDETLYWVADAWCLEAGCPCTEVALNFLAHGGGQVGTVRVDTRTGRPDVPSSDRRGLELWEVLSADPEILEELRRRRTAMRRVARGLPALRPKTAPVARTTAKVGRNDPCPCGSGKKHKRCCG